MGIERDRVPSRRSDFASFLRSYYRQCDRIAEVNLAYTVLKNKNLRKDYDWMLEYHGHMKQMHELFELGDEDFDESDMMEMMFEEMISRMPDNEMDEP
ncbi:MAG: hypothetical protein QGH39_01325 [Candidatus Thermoplasmatota archaeon]|nr:hypothetical protein [Candidatus Thermoplasmatota archaeon]MDP7264181.1 hypothetical protein [Candidatus Thermoplasmatota archaeon]